MACVGRVRFFKICIIKKRSWIGKTVCFFLRIFFCRMANTGKVEITKRGSRVYGQSEERENGV